MICIIGHEIKTESGFKVFEAGVDYPESEIGDRVKYFADEAAQRTQINNREEPEEKPPKRTKKVNEEVEL